METKSRTLLERVSDARDGLGFMDDAFRQLTQRIIDLDVHYKLKEPLSYLKATIQRVKDDLQVQAKTVDEL